MPGIQVEGMSGLLVKLKELPNRIANNIVNQALEAGAAPILAAAKANVPVDTGFLRDSLKLNRERVRQNSYLVRVGTELGDYQGKSFYGSFIEYGYRRGKRQSRRKRVKGEDGKNRLVANELFSETDKRPVVPAQPYLRPAFDENVTTSIDIISQYLGSAIEREASK
jgi:HK97 gp10 family phage protein